MDVRLAGILKCEGAGGVQLMSSMLKANNLQSFYLPRCRMLKRLVKQEERLLHGIPFDKEIETLPAVACIFAL